MLVFDSAAHVAGLGGPPIEAWQWLRSAFVRHYFPVDQIMLLSTEQLSSLLVPCATSVDDEHLVALILYARGTGQARTGARRPRVRVAARVSDTTTSKGQDGRRYIGNTYARLDPAASKLKSMGIPWGASFH